MPNERREGLNRRDFMMAAIGLVGASASLASIASTANAQDTEAPPMTRLVLGSRKSAPRPGPRYSGGWPRRGSLSDQSGRTVARDPHEVACRWPGPWTN